MKAILPLPPSWNQYLKMGHRRLYKTDMARAWEELAWLKLRNFRKFGKAKVEVFITYYFKDIRSDLKNRSKILLDMVEKCGIIDNDCQVYALHEYKEIDRHKLRCIIQIDKLEE